MPPTRSSRPRGITAPPYRRSPGAADSPWGEIGKAVVVLKEGKDLTQEEIIVHLKGRLATYKIPKGVVFTEALPRNGAGKVLKTLLRGTLG